MVNGFLPSRKLILGVSALLLAVSFLLYSGAVILPRFSVLPAVVRTPELEVRPELSAHAHLGHHDNNVAVDKVENKGLKGELKEEKLLDVADNSKAIVYLKKYKKIFNGNQGEDVNPNKESDITKWWQAAAMIDWYIHSPIRYACKKRTPMGNWHICQDEPFTVKPPCLTYSFGINWDFSFDDAMGKLGCEVHSFDPSMNNTDHKRNEHVTFHAMGLGATNSDSFSARQDIYVKDDHTKWKMRTLKSIVEMLKHENRVIDVLKIDIEGHEWAVIDHLIETDMFQYVRQFMLEFHLFPTWPAKEDYVHLYKSWTRLREMGFREFAIGPHPQTLTVDKFNNQGDNEYVNYFFRRKDNWTS